MVSPWNYTVIHYDKDSAWASTDLTDNVVAIPLFTDTGTDEYNTAIVKLSAVRGKYITSAPKIKRDDRIRIVATDGFGGSYSKVFNVKKTVPSKSKEEGVVLQLNLRGIEEALDDINYAKRVDYDYPSNVITNIITNYNLQKGTLNPTITGNIVIPTASKNSFEFGINEEKSYTRILEVLDSLAQSVDDNGLLDFYECNPSYHASNVTSLTFNVFSSGGTDTGVTITNSTNVNVGESEGGIANSRGTVINGWGSPDVGSLPPDFSRFASAALRFNLYPEWASGVSYKQNAKVRYNGTVYRSNINNNTSTPPTNWTSRTAAQDYGNVITYSPWTVENSASFPRSRLWKNSGCDLGISASDMGPGMWDSNLVIWDTANNSFQTWADVKGTNLALDISSKFLYSGSGDPYYEGMRILVNGVGLAGLGGTDSNGVSRNNSIVEYTKKDDGTYEWRVKYSGTTNLRCAVISEGRIYRYNGAAWADDSANTKHCWHPYDSVSNVTSIVTGTSFTTNNNSAIRFRYRFNTPALLTTPSEYQRCGAWACLRFPFPHNTAGTPTPLEAMGSLFGGTISSKVPFLDAQNMTYTHDGKTGFNQGASSEDLGPINAIAFWCKLAFYTDPTGLGGYTYKVQTGNFNMRAILYDRNDNVVVQDFVIPFNDNPYEVKLPLGGFQIYRANKSIDTITDGIVPPKQNDVQNQFEWRHIKQFVIQTQDSYDSIGRFITSAAPTFPIFLGPNRFAKTPMDDGGLDPFRQVDLTIDAFRFIKPLLVNSGQVFDYVREPEFIDKPEIGDYYQLNGIVKSELEKATYEQAQFDINTTGKFDIPFGQSFYYADPELIDYSDNGANTVKLVAKKINYSITKPKNGVGGFLRTIVGARRFI